LELLEVSGVGADSVLVRSSNLQAITLKGDKLGPGYHDAVRLAFRTDGRREIEPRTRPITMNAIVDRDLEGNCVGVICVGVNLGAG